MAPADSSISGRPASIAPALHLFFQVTDKLLPLFFNLTEQGFEVEVRTGGSVREVLCRQLGIDGDYLDQRIQTIFLNARPVDDVDSTRVDSGATLALSGAMPGLMGATLRKGGFFASLRQDISYHKDNRTSDSAARPITLKLFNLVAQELGPPFLHRGITIKGQDFQHLLAHHLESLSDGGASCERDGRPIALKDLAQIDLLDKKVFLQVTAAKVEFPSLSL